MQFALPGVAVSLAHGGELAIGKRKTARPIVTKRPMHIVFKSSSARGAWSLLRPRNATAVKMLLARNCSRFQVRVLEGANVGNHLHLVVRAKSRTGLQGFLRAFAGGVAMVVTGGRKGAGLEKKFWSDMVFSRVVQWGRDFRGTAAYVLQNQVEGIPICFASSSKWPAEARDLSRLE